MEFQTDLGKAIAANAPRFLDGMVLPKRLYHTGKDPIAWTLKTRFVKKGDEWANKVEFVDSVSLTHVPITHTDGAWSVPEGGTSISATCPHAGP